VVSPNTLADSTNMAQSRLEKIGSIYSRLQGLRKSKAIKPEQIPIWAEVYEAFPPMYEPRWDSKDAVLPVKKILYREDSVRANYYKVFGNTEEVNLFSDTKLTSQLFVDKYLALHDEGKVPADQVWDHTIQALELDGVRLGAGDVKPSSEDEETLFKDKKSLKSSIYFQDLFSKDNN